ncbi:hypothetical protein C8R43DRAFT_1240962 [Mycena crocata]|nr:hypothetical protein C8R43DRAFT_1240962 [Mycena crocata]
MECLPIYLRCTNEPPTTVQSDYARQLISKRQKDSLDLSQQYYLAQLTLSDIAARQHATQRDIACLKAILSPIRRVPNEILVEIFQILAATSRFLAFHYSIEDPRSSPLLLTHVCSLWRRIAVNTPRLWNRLELYFPRELPNKTVPILRELVRRSSPHSITTRIHTFDWQRPGKPLDFMRILISLPEFCERVENLDLTIHLLHFHSVLSLPRPTFPRLRNLHIHGSREDAHPEVTRVLELFKCAPLLRKLDISITNTERRFSSSFPWHQLVDLTLTDLDLLDARAILIQCNNLRSFFLEDFCQSEREEVDLAICTLPNLHRLVLNSDFEVPRQSTSPFFKFFSFPNLRHLNIDIAHWDEDDLLTLQERSHFELTYLALHNIFLGAPVITRFLQQNRSVEELGLHQFHDQGIIAALTYRYPQTTVLLPRLREIYIAFEYSDYLDGEGEALVDMLESRWDLEELPDDAPLFAECEKADLAISGSPLDADVEERLLHMASFGFVVDHIPRE